MENEDLIKKLTADIDQLRVQLGGCLLAAQGQITNAPKDGDYAWSPAYAAVVALWKRFEAVRRDNGGEPLTVPDEKIPEVEAHDGYYRKRLKGEKDGNQN